MIRLKFIFIALLMSTALFSQQDPKWMERIDGDSLLQIDFLSYDYHGLDKEFKISIDSDAFDKAMVKYGYYPERINRYIDSLGVILMLNLNNWQKVRSAKVTIGYDWERLGYHTWQNIEEARLFAEKFNITHPWRMKQFLVDENNQKDEIVEFFKKLEHKVASETARKDLEQLSREELLNVALRCNPQRIADFERVKVERQKQREAYLKEHGSINGAQLGVSCGKENCCQTKSGNK